MRMPLASTNRWVIPLIRLAPRRRWPFRGRAEGSSKRASRGIGNRYRSCRWRRCPHELRRTHPDQPDLLLRRVLAVVQEGQQQADGSGVEGLRGDQGLPGGVRPREGRKVREAHRHGDGPERRDPLTAETLKNASGELLRALENERRVEGVVLERLLLADGLRLPLVRHRALRDPPRLGVEVLTPAAEPVDELEEPEVAELTDGVNAAIVEQQLR